MSKLDDLHKQFYPRLSLTRARSPEVSGTPDDIITALMPEITPQIGGLDDSDEWHNGGEGTYIRFEMSLTPDERGFGLCDLLIASGVIQWVTGGGSYGRWKDEQQEIITLFQPYERKLLPNREVFKALLDRAWAIMQTI